MEQKNESKQTISEILSKIKQGNIKMRPKWYFILHGSLILIGGVLLGMALLYLGSFILFTLRRTGVLFAPGFGFQGWYIFLISLPWFLIVLSLIFVVILELLVRHYAFAYRRPLLYSLLGILVFVLFGGFIVNQTSLHRDLMRSADRDDLPFAGQMYRAYGRPRLNQVHAGVVTELTREGCAMQDLRGEMLSVLISPQTRMQIGVPLIIGDHIVVIGERFDDTIRALGIRKVIDWRD
jgi:hypothetical protein